MINQYVIVVFYGTLGGLDVKLKRPEYYFDVTSLIDFRIVNGVQ